MQHADPDSGKALLAAGITPVPPGMYLMRVILPSMDIGTTDAAQKMGVPESALLDIIYSRQRVTENMAEALASFTDISVKFWLNMQAATDLARAEQAR
jgi:addiction module HigA family antidote